MNKNELKEGEIYKVKLKNNVSLTYSVSLTYIMKATKDLKNVKNIPSYNSFMKEGDFNNDNNIFEIATPEQKHWLNTCIKQDKFVSYEEAMKSFIPEYVECIKALTGITIGKILSVENNMVIDGTFNNYSIKANDIYNYFKPSTKEAYDAQFVIKEPEFVLPEKWCILRTKENYKIINNFFEKKENNKNRYCFSADECYLTSSQINNNNWLRPIKTKSDNHQDITFEQFKKYVLKEEQPVIISQGHVDQLKLKEQGINSIVLENKVESKPFEILSIVNNITKEQLDLKKDGYFRSKYSSIHLNNINDKYSIVSVANQEGNIFEIKDLVMSVKSKRKTVQTIKSFKYSSDKSRIQTVTSLHQRGIDINRLEHFIEVEPKFVLPDAWYVVVNKENLDTLSKWIFENSNFKLVIGGIVGKNNFQGCKNSKGWNVSKLIKGKYYDFGNEITFEQFKKYVLKETEESKLITLPIKLPVVEETLLERAKRLYPIGTKFKVACQPHVICTVLNHDTYHLQTSEICNLYVKEQYYGVKGATVYYRGEWAEIIGYEPQVSDDFIITYHGNGEITNNTKGNKIHKIIDFKGSYENLNSVITFQREHYKDTVLLRNIKIIK